MRVFQVEPPAPDFPSNPCTHPKPGIHLRAAIDRFQFVPIFRSMPLYEYKCLNCEKVQEVIQKFADAPLEVCPLCQGALKKLMSMSSFSLKGTGWHNTDYKRASSAPSGGAPAQDTQVGGSGQAGAEPGAQNSAQTSKDSGSDGIVKNGKESNGKDKAPTAAAGKGDISSGSEKKTTSPSAEGKSSEKSTSSAASKVAAKV